MTELERLEQVHAITEHLIGLQDAQASFIAIFLTGVFAFILAAHSAGSKLTTFQVTICSTVFILFAFVIGLRIITFGIGMNEMMLELNNYRPAAGRERFELVDSTVRLAIACIVWASGPIVALLFMWSVRHAKTE